MSTVALRSIQDDEPEQYAMRFRELSAVQSKNDYFKMDPRKLKVEPGFNIRDLDAPHNRAHIDDLKASIKVNGVRKPIEVRMEGKHAFVVDGHCRLAAVLELISEGAEIRAIPAIPEAEGVGPEERTLNALIAGTGRRPEPLEVAIGVKRLRDFGWEIKDIAERMGWKSTNTVKQHLELIALPESDKRKINDGKVSATTARQMAKGISREAGEELWKKNEEENKRLTGAGKKERKLTPRAVKQAKEAAKPKPEPKSVSAPPPQAASQAPAAAPESPAVEPLTKHELVELGYAPQDQTVVVLTELTRQAHLVLQHNQSESCPGGYWTPAFRDAIRTARDLIENLTGKPMEFEALPDPTSQETEQA